MQKFINIDPMEPGQIPENTSLLHDEEAGGPNATTASIVPESAPVHEEMSTNPMPRMTPYKVPDRTSSVDMNAYEAPTAVLPRESVAATSRTREQRAMKEPKSLRK
jgi:hypothetical protein